MNLDIFWKRPLGLLVVVIALGLAACAPAPRVSSINDPFEADNRKTHEANKEIDRTLLKPLSGTYGHVTNGPISKGINNFSSNQSLPGIILNDMLQLNLTETASNTFRFLLNSTFGLAGLFDVATQNGVPEKETDFGETLHVWGFGEGRYIELPIFGPSTERDTVGLIVDFVIDPVSYVVPAPQKYIGTASHILNRVGDRDRYADLVESILYESADSYSQSRIIYLQSRRHDLAGGLTDADLEDPYAD